MPESELSAVTQLYDLSTRLVGEIGLESLLDEVSAATVALLKADFATIELCDPATGHLTLVAQRGPVQPSTEYVHRMHLASDREDSLRSRTRVLAKVESLLDRLDSTPDAVGSGVRLSTPLLGPAGRPLGVISAHYLKPPGPAARELQFFDLYSRHAASVIERDRRLRQEKLASREARDEFSRREACLAEAERLSHTGSWALNTLSGELRWSEELFRICGVDPAHFRPTLESGLQLIHPDDRVFVSDLLARSVAERADFECDCRVLRPTGEARFIHGRARAVFNDLGSLTGYVGSIIDTTETRRADEDRRQLVRRVMAAQEDERRRIAREMHDLCGARLAELSVCIGSIRVRCDDRPAVCRELDALEATARQLDSDLAFMIRALRPTALDDLGLVAALRAYSQAWSRRYGVTARIHCAGLEGSRLSPESETALYRIMQEALTNVATHAHASQVSVILERRSDIVRLIIEDDGIGFNVARSDAGARDRCGLVGMSERAALLGGTLDIESSITGGTTLITRIPCSRVLEHPGGEGQ